MAPLNEVFDLVLENSEESVAVLRQRHDMHALSGKWEGSNECHACNADDWLLIWKTGNGIAVFQRNGGHDDPSPKARQMPVAGMSKP
jgi:mRNA interferase YafQ